MGISAGKKPGVVNSVGDVCFDGVHHWPELKIIETDAECAQC